MIAGEGRGAIRDGEVEGQVSDGKPTTPYLLFSPPSILSAFISS